MSNWIEQKLGSKVNKVIKERKILSEDVELDKKQLQEFYKSLQDVLDEIVLRVQQSKGETLASDLVNLKLLIYQLQELPNDENGIELKRQVLEFNQRIDMYIRFLQNQKYSLATRVDNALKHVPNIIREYILEPLKRLYLADQQFEKGRA